MKADTLYTWFDTETCGFHGPICLYQFCRSDKLDDSVLEAPIELYSPWHEPIGKTLEIYEELCNTHVRGFNLSFDWFHICQQYTTLLELARTVGVHKCPVDYIEAYALAEAGARSGPCLKPVSAFDIMMHARKGPYQSTMDREDIRIKRVPRILADQVIKELNSKITFKDIYFAKKKDKNERWKAYDIEDDMGNIIPEFVDLVLSFAPSSALKALAVDALNIESTDRYIDVDVDESLRPEEHGYAPFATAIGKPGKWNKAWPDVISEYLIHWNYNERARTYAMKDVDYTRRLDSFFGWQPGGDHDSVLACLVGAVRWTGFEIDLPKIKKMHAEAVATQKSSIANFNSQEVCRKYLGQVLSETESMVMMRNDKLTTKAIVLEEIAKWKMDDVCGICNGGGCDQCTAGLVPKLDDAGQPIPHPAAVRANEILEYRHAGKEIETLEKLITAGRFHVSLKVIGALSGRMSGADGLNAQGMKRTKEFRSCFPLAGKGEKLNGGDFAGFEVVIAEAVYNDPELRKDLTTLRPCKKCAKVHKKTPLDHRINYVTDMGQTIQLPVNPNCGDCKGTGLEDTKIHALFGQYLFPPMTYDEIYDTKGLPGDQDKYGRSKNGVFALLYGGEEYTLANRVGVSEEVAKTANERWAGRYLVWGQAREKIKNEFCSMRQSGGIGSKVTWSTPSDYIETMYGFRRYFTLENAVAKVLFDLANDPPKEWAQYKHKIVRRDREQTPSGALRSACFGCAFGLQAGNMRAAANHVIQGTGAETTKRLQVKIWEMQPVGVHEWIVKPFQIHDEVMCPTKDEPRYHEQLLKIVGDFVVEMKSMIPLIAIDWSNGLKTWADK